MEIVYHCNHLIREVGAGSCVFCLGSWLVYSLPYIALPLGIIGRLYSVIVGVPGQFLFYDSLKKESTSLTADTQRTGRVFVNTMHYFKV